MSTHRSRGPGIDCLVYHRAGKRDDPVMRPAARLPRRYRLGWRDLDRSLLSWVALSLLAHGATAAAIRTEHPVPAARATTAHVVGFITIAKAAPPPPDWRMHGQGVHEIIGSPPGDGPAAGDLLAGGGLDEDLAVVLAQVEGVRLPLPGEGSRVRRTRWPPRDLGHGCSIDEQGRMFCRCLRGRSSAGSLAE